jgi:hypothetical protein
VGGIPDAVRIWRCELLTSWLTEHKEVIMKPSPVTRVLVPCILAVMLLVSCNGNERAILGTWSCPRFSLEFLQDGNGIFVDDRDQLGFSYELLEGDRLIIDFGLGRILTGPTGKAIGFVDVPNNMLILGGETSCVKRTN